MDTILAGDVGGTKTHLALFTFDAGWKCLREEKFPSKEFPNLTVILAQFLAVGKEKIAKACIGVAGPVEDGRCHATNLPWVVDAREVAKEAKIGKAWLINDLEANAWGLKCLRPDEFFVLNEGVPHKGNAALISAGTGLGEAGLYWDGKQHLPFACEGGHADFSPSDEQGVELWRYLKKQFDHPSWERVLSGPGLEKIYQFLTGDAEVTPAKVITEKASTKQSPLYEKAVLWFTSLYGCEAGNLALKMMARGGVYIGGGIAPKVLWALKNGNFMKAFVAKGRFRDMMSAIPVKVVLNVNAALLGAAQYAHEKK